MIYYLYRHIRLDKNEPFYIGIGKTNIKNKYSVDSEKYKRAYSKLNRNVYWKNIVSKIPYEVEIVLETPVREEIIQKEIEFIKLYGRKDLKLGTLVNLTNGGEGKEGSKLSKETKDKMSKSARTNITEERKLQLFYQLNKNHSTKGKFGKEHHRAIKVFQYSLNGEFIKEWESLMDIKRELGFGLSHISQCLNNKRNKSKGFVWKKVRL